MIDPALLSAMLALIDETRAAAPDRLAVIAICGAQGSGKSTLVGAVAAELAEQGIAAAVLSLDDLYLTRTERLAMAEKVHPLLATRGVPGTHDIALGLRTIAALERGEAMPLPRFDKSADDRLPEAHWPRAPAGTQVLLFEGWCLGARAQPDVTEPVNALESGEDAAGVWRSYANAALAGDYQRLFDRIDRLVLLAASDWAVVAGWREQQEAALRKRGGAAVMSPDEVRRFIQHYERLTRWILTEMPARADLTVRLGPAREVLTLERLGRGVG